MNTVILVKSWSIVVIKLLVGGQTVPHEYWVFNGSESAMEQLQVDCTIS